MVKKYFFAEGKKWCGNFDLNIKADLSPEEYDNFEGGIVTLCIEDCGAACLAMIASYFGKYKKNNTYKKGHKRSHLKFVLFMTYSDNNFSSIILEYGEKLNSWKK